MCLTLYVNEGETSGVGGQIWVGCLMCGWSRFAIFRVVRSVVRLFARCGVQVGRLVLGVFSGSGMFNVGYEACR